MSKRKQSLVGKIGFCLNRDLGLKDRNGNFLSGGHYVYIRQVNGNRCNVHTITSLEDNGEYDTDKIRKVRAGFLYPVPKKDANFPKWSAVNLDGNIQPVETSKIKDIGSKSINKRHHSVVNKFAKK